MMRDRKFAALVLLCVALVCLPTTAFAEFTSRQTMAVAQSYFNKTVPDSLRVEYKFFSSKPYSLLPGYYEFVWVRYVNNVLVDQDRFTVLVNTADGSLYQSPIFVYTYPDSQLITTPTLTADQAKWIIEKNYAPLTSTPFLEIHDGKLLCLMTIKSGYVIGVDAITGENTIVGTPQGSQAIQQVPTKFNPTAYYLDRFGIYILAIGITAIAISSFVVIRHRNLSSKKFK